MNATIARFVVPSIVLVAAFAVLPATTSAATSPVNTQSAQLLPTGAQTCLAMPVTAVMPHVYDGQLHSFDIITPDASYVAIGGSAGNAVLPFNYMTRWGTPEGQVKIHTDTDPIRIGQGISVSVTLLSAANGKTCVTTVAFSVLPDVSYPTTNAPTGSATPNAPTSQGPNSGGSGAPTQLASTTSATTTIVPGSQAGGFCEGRGALWLWMNLIIAYAIVAAIAALSRTPMVLRNPAIPVAMILVPLILLVGFWYFSPACRAGAAVPLILLVIAIIGLLIAFRDKKGGPLMLLAVPPKPMQMPAAKPKIPETPKQAPAPKSSTPATNPHAQKILEKLRAVQQELGKSAK